MYFLPFAMIFKWKLLKLKFIEELFLKIRNQVQYTVGMENLYTPVITYM